MGRYSRWFLKLPVALRFLAGLNIDGTADALAVSTATVERDWTVAKAWLLQRLSPRR